MEQRGFGRPALRGDRGVRRRGSATFRSATSARSAARLAHADPAADMPAVMLALGATLAVRSTATARASCRPPTSSLGPFTTTLATSELITESAFRRPRRIGLGVRAVEHPASGFALAGAAVLRRGRRQPPQSRVTGVGGLAVPPEGDVDDADMFGDRFAPEEYRRSLARRRRAARDRARRATSEGGRIVDDRDRRPAAAARRAGEGHRPDALRGRRRDPRPAARAPRAPSEPHALIERSTARKRARAPGRRCRADGSRLADCAHAAPTGRPSRWRARRSCSPDSRWRSSSPRARPRRRTASSSCSWTTSRSRRSSTSRRRWSLARRSRGGRGGHALRATSSRSTPGRDHGEASTTARSRCPATSSTASTAARATSRRLLPRATPSSRPRFGRRGSTRRTSSRRPPRPGSSPTATLVVSAAPRARSSHAVRAGARRSACRSTDPRHRRRRSEAPSAAKFALVEPLAAGAALALQAAGPPRLSRGARTSRHEPGASAADRSS